MAKVKKGNIITVTSMKGGVGKTTTTLLLASIFSNMKKKTLVVDLDLYSGSIAFCLNLEFKNSIFNLCDDISNNRCKLTDLDNYLYKYNDYISILPAPKDPRQANKIEKTSIEILLNNLVYSYDVILLDTNHVLDVTNMLAFDYSDSIIDVFNNDSISLKCSKTFVSICKNVEVNNLILVLNNAIDDRKRYFSPYDMKTLHKENTDYIISSDYYFREYDQILLEGKIINFFSNKKIKGYKDVEKLALNLLDNKKGAKLNEEK